MFSLFIEFHDRLSICDIETLRARAHFLRASISSQELCHGCCPSDNSFELSIGIAYPLRNSPANCEYPCVIIGLQNRNNRHVLRNCIFGSRGDVTTIVSRCYKALLNHNTMWPVTQYTGEYRCIIQPNLECRILSTSLGFPRN